MGRGSHTVNTIPVGYKDFEFQQAYNWTKNEPILAALTVRIAAEFAKCQATITTKIWFNSSNPNNLGYSGLLGQLLKSPSTDDNNKRPTVDRRLGC